MMTPMEIRLQVQYLGLDAARTAIKKKVLDVTFKPEGSTSLDKPKEGEHDPSNDPHEGGNRWAGGVSAVIFFEVSTANTRADRRSGHCRAWRKRRIQTAVYRQFYQAGIV
jgi:hypothetical protein